MVYMKKSIRKKRKNKIKENYASNPIFFLLRSVRLDMFFLEDSSI